MAPPSRNTYLEYKRNTARLIKWVVTTADTVSEKLGATLVAAQVPASTNLKRNLHGKGKRKKQPDPVSNDPAPPTSPEINATKLIQLSRLISSPDELKKPVPTTIYSLFESVIRSRTAAYSFWLDIEATEPSDETRRSNEGHKGFIDALQAAFEVLGGLEWQAKRDTEKQKIKEAQANKNEEAFKADELDLENRFGGLEIDDIPSDEETEASKQAEWMKDIILQLSSSQRGGSRKSKASQKAARQSQGTENYKIKSDSEARFAATCFMNDLFDLRSYIASVWQEVADDKLNAAVAGALSNLAAGVVEQLQFSIAADFPQCSNFRAIIDLLIPGNAELKPPTSQTSSPQNKIDGEATKNVSNFNSLDLKESCFVNPYRDLVTFIEDYRKGRNCRPTPRVAKFTWDPSLDLHTLSEDERQKWRSNFCIMWLYDMVNQFASTRLTADKHEQPLETVDWKSASFGRRVLFGPTKFCGEVTSLAMALKKSPLVEKIQPHMVFQVQVMLDSMTTYKGWHFEIPAACTPPRTSIGPEVPFELGRHMEDMEAFKENFLDGSERLLKEFKETDPIRWEFPLKNIPPLVSEVGIVLGDSLLSRLTHRDLQSRFLDTNRNGLWVYCPWVCGVGLAQALNVAFDWGRVLWDNSGIPLAMFHFYNIMLESKYLPRGSMPLFEDLLVLFGNQVFRGKRPKKEFFKRWNTASGIKAQYHAPASTKRLGKGGRIVMNGKESSLWRKEVRTFGELSKLFSLGDANWISEKVERKKFPTLLAQQQLVTVHKGKHNLRETNTSFLEAIKKDLEDDITGPIPFTGLNFMHILWLFNDLFRKMYEETTTHPISLAHPLPAHGKWQDTVLYLALYPALNDDQAGRPIESDLLRCMGEIFEREMSGVELKDYVYFDKGRNRKRPETEEDEEPGWRDFEKFITRGGFFKRDEF